jgi:hypothetical protein
VIDAPDIRVLHGGTEHIFVSLCQSKAPVHDGLLLTVIQCDLGDGVEIESGLGEGLRIARASGQKKGARQYYDIEKMCTQIYVHDFRDGKETLPF